MQDRRVPNLRLTYREERRILGDSQFKTSRRIKEHVHLPKQIGRTYKSLNLEPFKKKTNYLTQKDQHFEVATRGANILNSNNGIPKVLKIPENISLSKRQTIDILVTENMIKQISPPISNQNSSQYFSETQREFFKTSRFAQPKSIFTQRDTRYDEQKYIAKRQPFNANHPKPPLKPHQSRKIVIPPLALNTRSKSIEDTNFFASIDSPLTPCSPIKLYTPKNVFSQVIIKTSKSVDPSEKLRTTLERIGKPNGNKFSPFSPKSVLDSGNKVQNVIMKNIYRVYGMDKLNKSKVKGLLSHEKPPAHNFDIEESKSAELYRLKRRTQSSDTGVDAVMKEGNIFAYNHLKDGYDFTEDSPWNLDNFDIPESVREEQQSRCEPSDLQNTSRIDIEKIDSLRDEEGNPYQKAMTMVGNFFKKTKNFKTDFTPYYQGTKLKDLEKKVSALAVKPIKSANIPRLGEKNTDIATKTHNLDHLCEQIKSDNSKMHETFRQSRKMVSRTYSQLEVKAKRFEVLESLKLN